MLPLILVLLAQVQQFKLVVALVDPNGNIVTAKEGTMDFALTDATWWKPITASTVCEQWFRNP